MRKLKMEELERKSVADFKQADKTPVTIILDNVRSLQNVGSVFRTADAFLLEAVYLCGYTGRPPHRDIQKTALGATETIHWEYFQQTAEAVKKLKEKGYAIWSVEQVTQSQSLQDFQPEEDRPIALVFGNEVHGVDSQVLPLCDGCIEIPQLGMKHSLNISVSVGIVVWDVVSKLKIFN